MKNFRPKAGSAPLAACLVTLSLLGPCAYGQRVSLGVVGGGYANRDFDERHIPAPGFSPTQYESLSGGYIIGASLDANLSPRLSISAEALYKPLHYREAVSFSEEGRVLSYAPATVVTWQYPVLARYRFSLGRLRPFVEGGPSFRVTGNLNSADPSHFGVTAGVGWDAQWGRVTLSPRLRYTRWAEDPSSAGISTRSDQTEFLTRLSYTPDDNARLLGRRISLGVVIGPDVSGGSKTITYTTPGPNGIPIAHRRTSRPGHLVAGPLIELNISPKLSIEGNAITSSWVSEGSSTWQDQVREFSGNSDRRWVFPVLLKYRLTARRIRPFLSAGPSFQLPSGPSRATRSSYGITAGGGVEIAAKQIRVAPGVRYTRWAPGAAGSTDSPNQMYLIVGVSF